MIARLMGDAQYEIDDALLADLNAIDERAVAAFEAGDEADLDARLDEMWEVVRERGERLPDEDLRPSDVLVPPSDLTLEETRSLLGDDGFIPDLPG